MITITRSLARQVRAVFRKALGITPYGLTYPVSLETGPGGLIVRAMSPDAAVEYFERCSLPAGRLRVPFELLSDCEGRKPEPVQLEPDGDKAVVAQWRDGNVPQIVRYDAPTETSKDAFPETTGRLGQNLPGILAALHDAAQSTDPDSARFATGCIQLRGRDGSIRATDGRQLLVQGGFSLPWEDDALVPGTTLFGCRELPRDQPVQIGRSGDWATFVVGSWTIHLRINKDGRFPDLDHHIPRDSAVTARCTISPADASFLAETLRKLPSDDEHNDPVTLDLNGSVSVRAKGTDRPQATEVVLSNSSYSGEPVRINTNRYFLARALHLGFRELHVVGPKAPVQCRDDQRRFVWAPLDPESALKPAADALRIVSPTEQKSTVPINRIKRSKPTMTEPTVNQETPAKANGQAGTNNHARKPARRKAGQPDAAVLIEQAEKVRAAARALYVQAGELMKALKQHRRQNRAVANTLRQLKTIQV